MAFTHTQLIIFIIAAAGVSSLLQVRAQFEYSANKATVKIGENNGSEMITNNFIHPPRRLTVFYLDAANAAHVSGGKFDSLVKKAVYERSASQVQREIEEDDRINLEFVNKKRAWKLKSENGEDAGDEPKQGEREKDPAISGTLDLTFNNLDSQTGRYLRIDVLEISYEDVIVVVYNNQNIAGIRFTRSSGNKDGYLMVEFDRIYFSETIFGDLVDALNNRPVMKEPDLKKDFVVSNWNRPSDRCAFAFAIKESVVTEFKPKIFIENHILNIYVYKDRPFLRLRHTVTNDKVNIKIEKMDALMGHFDVTLKPWMKNIRVLLRNPNEKPTVVYSKAITANGDFDANRHMEDAVADRYTRMGNARYYLRKTSDSVDIEVDMVTKLEDEELILKVVQSKGISRISFFQKDRFQSRTKTIRSFKHRNNLPLELNFVSARSRSSQRFEYDRKMLIDYSLFRPYHFNQYILSESFINEKEITTRNGNSAKEIVDFAWVKNYNSKSEILKSMHFTDIEESNVLSIYMHDRDAGLITAFRPGKIILHHLTLSADDYSVDQTLPATVNFGSTFNFKGYILDVNNGFQEFEKKSFEIVKNQIYFLAFDTHMQKQLDNLKVEVCENNPGTVTLCIFSYVNYLEIDQYNDKLVFHQQYFPTTVGLGGVKYNYDFEVVVLDRNKCGVEKKTPFTRFTSYDFKKFWVKMEFRFINDKFTTTTCDDGKKICYIVFVKSGIVKPSPANLKTLKVDLSTRTCTIDSRKDVLFTMEKNKIAMNIDKDNGGMGFEILDSSGIDLEQVKYAAWNVEETGSFLCQKNDKDPKKCDLNYVFFKDLTNSISNEVLNEQKTPLTAPVVLLRPEYPMLNFNTYYKPGDITIVFTQGYVDLSNDMNALGFLGFNKRKIFQKSGGHFKATLKLFLLSTVPVVVPLSFTKYMNFEEIYKNNESFEVVAKTVGNVDEIFTYIMYNELAKATFSVYFIENSKNELEILVYNDNVLEVMESVEGKMRGPLADFRELLVGDKNQRTQNLVLKINWKEYTSPTMYMCWSNKNTFLHMIETAYANVVVMVVLKASFENNDPNSYSQAFFSEPYAKRPTVALMDLASKYQEENAEGYRRLI
jgi:hypothetical protein